MSSYTTIGQILAADNFSDSEKNLLDRYFEVILNEGKPDPQLANEMFQAFSSLPAVRFGNVIFTREGL